MFTNQNGDDPDRPNIGIVVTDGRSNDMTETWIQAINAREAGIEMIAVGVGGNYRLVCVKSWYTL